MKPSTISDIHFVIVAALLLATGMLLQLRGRVENIPHHELLASFPSEMGEWTGLPIPISGEERQILGDGDFMEQVYRSRTARMSDIDLFVAYFPTQRAGSTIHSPKNCLPGSGWIPLESRHVSFQAPGGATLMVNRYVIAKDSDRRLVLYWYQAHNRVVANEYLARFYLVADALKMNRTDGALIRIITPIVPNESTEDAQARSVQFAQQSLPEVSRFIPD